MELSNKDGDKVTVSYEVLLSSTELALRGERSTSTYWKGIAASLTTQLNSVENQWKIARQDLINERSAHDQTKGRLDSAERQVRMLEAMIQHGPAGQVPVLATPGGKPVDLFDVTWAVVFWSVACIGGGAMLAIGIGKACGWL